MGGWYLFTAPAEAFHHFSVQLQGEGGFGAGVGAGHRGAGAVGSHGGWERVRDGSVGGDAGCGMLDAGCGSLPRVGEREEGWGDWMTVGFCEQSLM